MEDDDDCKEDKLETGMDTCGLPANKGVDLSKLHTLNTRNLPPCAIQQWNKFEKHVRMPHLYPPSKSVVSSRWSAIKRSLENIQQRVNVQDFNFLKFFESILLSYNGSQKWQLRGIAMFYETLELDDKQKFVNLLDQISKLALQLPEICPEPVPLLRQRLGGVIHLTRLQIACLMANAFWCTFPSRNSAAVAARHSTPTATPDSLPIPTINFNRLFMMAQGEALSSKIRCVMNYFERVTQTSEKQRLENEYVTFERRVLHSTVSWRNSAAKFTNVRVTSQGAIEVDAKGLAHVNFANKLVGGGVLGRGCLQEEIRFLGFTEMIISRLFTEELLDNECLIVSGCERYNDYKGYGSSFTWIGNFKDETDKDLYGRCLAEVIVIDALRYVETKDQYEMRCVERELNKAYCGFKPNETVQYEPPAAIATGNWGCGDFHGNRHLKSLIQLMAAAEAKRDVLYFTHCDKQLVTDMCQVQSLLQRQSSTVGEVYRFIEEYSNYVKQTGSDNVQLYHFIQHHYGSSKSPPAV